MYNIKAEFARDPQADPVFSVLERVFSREGAPPSEIRFRQYHTGFDRGLSAIFTAQVGSLWLFPMMICRVRREFGRSEGPSYRVSVRAAWGTQDLVSCSVSPHSDPIPVLKVILHTMEIGAHSPP